MGQLIVKFANGNPKKAELRIEMDLPGWTEEEQMPVEIVVNGVTFRREEGIVQPAATPSAGVRA